MLEGQRTRFTYGEPIRVYFYIENNNKAKPYAPPSYAVNIKYILKDLTTGANVKGNEKWNNGLAKTMRSNLINGTTRNPLNIKARESFYFYPHLGEEFGTVKLSKAKVAITSKLRYNLNALPTGQYELTMEFYLYPSDKVLRKSVIFKVESIPDQMESTFQEFVKATVYAANSHYWAGRNYDGKHVNSYENFIDKHPDNIFADHATLDMISQIYAYKFISEPNVRETLNNYLDYGSEIEASDLKLTYGIHIPHVVSQLYEKDKIALKSSTNKVLKEVLRDSPEASKLLIHLSTSRNKLSGLTNYAADLK